MLRSWSRGNYFRVGGEDLIIMNEIINPKNSPS
jgi:hypothetical protein